MDYLKSIPDLLRHWLPVLITFLIGILVLTAAYRVLIKRAPPTSSTLVTRQLLMASLSAGLEPTVYSPRFTGLRIGEGIRQLRGLRPLRRVGFQRHAESYRSPRTLSAVWGVAGSNEDGKGPSRSIESRSERVDGL